jgi:hypothetical protein
MVDVCPACRWKGASAAFCPYCSHANIKASALPPSVQEVRVDVRSIQQSESWPVAASVLCFLAVAFTSPFNLILGLFSWGVLAKTFGSYFADNSRSVLFLLLALVQTVLFTLLWTPVYFLT